MKTGLFFVVAGAVVVLFRGSLTFDVSDLGVLLFGMGIAFMLCSNVNQWQRGRKKPKK